MNPILGNLISNEFNAKVGFELPTVAMYRVLRSTEEYKKVQVGLRSNILGRAEIREFVNSLMEELQPGHHFGYNSALMLLAVALEQDQRSFAEEYLKHLSTLDSAELSSASRMADYCLSRRGKSASNTFLETGFVPAREPESEWTVHEASSFPSKEPKENWIVE